jgi:hypothetical protein
VGVGVQAITGGSSYPMIETTPGAVADPTRGTCCQENIRNGLTLNLEYHGG